MRKLLLRIGCGLLSFLTSASVVNLQRPAIPAITFGPPESLAPPLPVYRCNDAPELPLPIEVLLNRNFPGWSFPRVSDDSCYVVKGRGGPDASAHLINGDFNDDGRSDYAVLIQQGARVDDNGGLVNPTMINIVAFFRKPNGYQMYHVSSEGGEAVILMRKGAEDYDYEKQREFTYPRDAIFSGMGMGGTTYLYEYGLFRAITTSD